MTDCTACRVGFGDHSCSPLKQPLCNKCGEPANKHGQFGFRDHAPVNASGNEINVEEHMEPSKEAIEEPPTFPDTGEGEERSGEQIEADEQAFSIRIMKPSKPAIKAAMLANGGCLYIEGTPEFEAWERVLRPAYAIDFAALRSELQAAQLELGFQKLAIEKQRGELQAAQAEVKVKQQLLDQSYVQNELDTDCLAATEAQLAAAQEQVRDLDRQLFGTSQSLTVAHNESWKLSEQVREKGAEIERLENFTPTAANINALPDKLRDYIHQIETRCDPAGDMASLVCARDQLAALQREVTETHLKWQKDRERLQAPLDKATRLLKRFNEDWSIVHVSVHQDAHTFLTEKSTCNDVTGPYCKQHDTQGYYG